MSIEDLRKAAQESPPEAAQDQALTLRPDATPTASEGQGEQAAAPIRENLPAKSEYSEVQNIPPGQVAEELLRMRRLMAERECKEVTDLYIPPPPNRQAISVEVQRGVTAAMADLPQPGEIEINPKELDSVVCVMQLFVQAAKRCDNFAYGFAGLGSVYRWFLGQALNTIKNELAPRGEWMAWYQKAGIDKDEVSRALRLHKSFPYPDALVGLSKDAAHKMIKKLNPKMPRKEKEPPPEKGWMRFVPPEQKGNKPQGTAQAGGEPALVPAPKLVKLSAEQLQAAIVEAPKEFIDYLAELLEAFAEEAPDGDATWIATAQRIVEAAEKIRKHIR
jgi:hypothetical protein